jgi:hypothetical protein
LQPHLYLQENFWEAGSATSTIRYFVIDAATGEVTRHAQSYQAYTDEGYRTLLAESGFEAIEFYPSLTGDEAEAASDLFALVGRKRGNRGE